MVDGAEVMPLLEGEDGQLMVAPARVRADGASEAVEADSRAEILLLVEEITCAVATEIAEIDESLVAGPEGQLVQGRRDGSIMAFTVGGIPLHLLRDRLQLRNTTESRGQLVDMAAVEARALLDKAQVSVHGDARLDRPVILLLADVLERAPEVLAGLGVAEPQTISVLFGIGEIGEDDDLREGAVGVECGEEGAERSVFDVQK